MPKSQKRGEGQEPDATATMTDKQARFVEEYVIDSNGTQAAIRAGYSKKAAKEIAYDLLTKTHIRAEVDRRLALLQDKCALTAENIIEELKRHAFTKHKEKIYYDDDSYRVKPLELLGKQIGMWRQTDGQETDRGTGRFDPDGVRRIAGHLKRRR